MRTGCGFLAVSSRFSTFLVKTLEDICQKAASGEQPRTQNFPSEMTREMCLTFDCEVVQRILFVILWFLLEAEERPIVQKNEVAFPPVLDVFPWDARRDSVKTHKVLLRKVK